MALHKLASIVVRPRRTWRIAALSAAALTAAGCSHNRQSYRPIFASPAPWSPRPAPTAAVRARRAVTDGDRPGGTVSSVPSLVDTPDLGLRPPSVVDGTGQRQGNGSSPQLDRGKTAQGTAGRRTGLERNHVARAGVGPGRRQDAARRRPKPVNPGSGSGPALQGPPRRLPRRGTPIPRMQCRPARRPRSRVRRASLSERLKPFLDESNANELMYPNKADRPWRYIVLHHSASASGNYDQIDGEHRKLLGIDGCGYHFVIGNGTGSRRRPDRGLPALE